MGETGLPPGLAGPGQLRNLVAALGGILASADSALFDLSRNASENVASLGLSLLWAVYAAVLIVLG